MGQEITTEISLSPTTFRYPDKDLRQNKIISQTNRYVVIVWQD